MRTLFEIIEITKDGDKPTYDECYYAMLALNGLLSLANMDIRCMADEKCNSPVLRKIWGDENHKRMRTALDIPPRQYLGDDVPSNPDYQYLRNIGKKLFDRVLAESNMQKQHEEPCNEH